MQTEKTVTKITVTKSSFKKILFNFVFWGYNIFFIIAFLLIARMIIGESSQVDYQTIAGEIENTIPMNVLSMLVVFVITPFISTGVAIFSSIRKQSSALMKLFFGFEIPLMGIAMARMVFLRQVTPIFAIFITSIVIGSIGVLIYLLLHKKTARWFQSTILISQQGALMVSAYIALLGFFFLPIVLAFFINILFVQNGIGHFFQGIGRMLEYANIFNVLLFLFVTIVFLSTLFFFAISPFMAFITFWKIFQAERRELVHHDKKFAWSLVAVFTVLFVSSLIISSLQFDPTSYTAQLDSLRKAKTFEEKKPYAQEIMKNDMKVRKGLLDSYLAQYRYLTDKSMNVLKMGYKNELFADQKTAEFIQKTFNAIAAPFVYKGTFEDDVKKASTDYQDLFDATIQEGEKDEITEALKKTNTQDELKAGLLNRNEKNVAVVSTLTTVNTHENNLFATVTVEEEYQNKTVRQQEVYYEFYLPEQAVITDLKLGPDLQFGSGISDDPAIPQPTQPPQSNNPNVPTTTPPKVDGAIVAPKGAAQTTYDAQVLERIDPALLEQVGPRQYKLRVFPIPIKGKPRWENDTTRQVKNQKMRFSYVVMIPPEGTILPQITETRNVYKDDTTKALIKHNGQEVAQLPSFIQQPMPCEVLQAKTEVGQVSFIPHALNKELNGEYSCGTDLADNKTVSGLKIALLLDSSYSNKDTNWTKYLKESAPFTAMLDKNAVDLFYFNDQLSGNEKITKEMLDSGLNTVYFGKTDRLNVLQQVPAGYDAVFMLTDASSSEVKPEKETVAASTIPVYLIHYHTKSTPTIPRYHDALTTYVVQSGGKVTDRMYEAVEDLYLTKKLNVKDPGQFINKNRYGIFVIGDTKAYIDGSVENKDLSQETYYQQLVQKELIMDYIQKSQQASQLSFLDNIHTLAQSSYIVTPFSSMIVLVNDAQREQLRLATESNNRFKRDFETGEEALSDPSGKGALSMGAVPEPHEWALIITGGFMLLYFYRRQVLQTVHVMSNGRIR